MAEITGDAVWDSLMADMDFLNNPPAVRVAQESFVRKLPVIAAAYLQEAVSLESLARTKAAYLQYCFEGGYIQILASAILAAGCQTMEYDRLVEFYSEKMSTFISGVDSLISETGEVLAETQISEKYFVMAIFQLNETAAKRYCADTLTIGELMLLDPLVLVRNF